MVEFENDKKHKIYSSFNKLNDFLDDFRSFSNNFHSQINPMVLEFKNDGGIYKDICAELLKNKFKAYKVDAKALYIPDFIRPSFKLFLLSLEKWGEYYESYLNREILNDKLAIIENKALALDAGFWNRIIKICRKFESLAFQKQKINCC